MDNIAVKFIKTENFLLKKTGIGGLPSSIIEAAQRAGDAIEFDYDSFAVQKVALMKQQLEGNDFIEAKNNMAIDDFLFNLIPFDVSAKLSKNIALAWISNNLLRFVESLPHLNIDNHHVIRAHVHSMDIVTKNNIRDIDTKIIKSLTNELKDACERYMIKYKNHKGEVEEWVVE